MRVSPREGGVATPKPAMVISRVDLKRLERNAGRACELLAAMANRSRLMILCQLAGGEKSVSDLQPLIGLSQSALSQHLAVLRAAGLVRARREGVQVFYSLADGAVRPLMHTLHAIYCGGNQA